MKLKMKLNLKSKKIRYIGSILLCLALIIFGVRACMRVTHHGEPVYLIAYEKTWYPMDLKGRAQNMVAFSQDLLRAIADETNFEVSFLEVSTSDLYEGLDEERYNAVISSIVPNYVNRRHYDFSDPIYPLGPVLVVKVNSPIKDIDDLKGKIIGVEVGTQQLYQITEESDYVMIPYKDVPVALESLDHNVVDAVLMDVLPAISYTQGYYRGRLKVATSPLIDAGIRIATLITPNNQLFLDEFNRGLQKDKR